MLSGGVMSDSQETIYQVIIPISKSAEFVKTMDFYVLFQTHFMRIYGLELYVNEKSENSSEIIFKGNEKSIQVVIEVLKEMGLTPSYKHDYSKYTDGDPNDYH